MLIHSEVNGFVQAEGVGRLFRAAGLRCLGPLLGLQLSIVKDAGGGPEGMGVAATGI